MNQFDLNLFGANQQVLLSASKYPKLTLARITEHHKDRYVIITEKGYQEARVLGKWMYQTNDPSNYPTVGDFVMVDNTEDVAIIHHLLDHSSVIERKTAGLTSDTQIIATNIDKVFICQSMNDNFNERRLERYLSMIWSSGAQPVILLTKRDLTDDPISFIEKASQIAIGVDLITCSDQEDDGYKELDDYLKPYQTYIFIGSSGVGKSTIINHLLGKDEMLTQSIGYLDRGRHTTTYKSLFTTPKNAIVIDTPGMREIQLDQADFDTSFHDIYELSKSCKFSDCTHENEPGCAVIKHIEDGLLSPERLYNYQKMKKELKYVEERQKYLERKRQKAIQKSR